jgi:rubrerythrin
VINGLAIGLSGAAGGAITGKLISRHLEADLSTVVAEKKFYRCPRCGTEFESNPKICSNCGKKIK